MGPAMIIPFVVRVPRLRHENERPRSQLTSSVVKVYGYITSKSMCWVTMRAPIFVRPAIDNLIYVRFYIDVQTGNTTLVQQVKDLGPTEESSNVL